MQVNRSFSSPPVDDFAAIWRDHAPALTRRARFLARDPEVAADLVQDVFERALRAGRDNVPAPRLRGWLMVILYNLFVDEVRTASGRSAARASEGWLPGPIPDEGGHDRDPPWSPVSLADAVQCLRELPPHLRQPLELRLEGHSYRDIGARLGLTISTVGTRIHRACHRLRAQLGHRRFRS
jgi:RNA polymerase sigma-70 factor (ECF subfamily)